MGGTKGEYIRVRYLKGCVQLEKKGDEGGSPRGRDGDEVLELLTRRQVRPDVVGPPPSLAAPTPARATRRGERAPASGFLVREPNALSSLPRLGVTMRILHDPLLQLIQR